MVNTKREIQATENILNSWDCLKHLTNSEKQRITYQLTQIAKTAISDYRQKCNSIEIDL